MLLASLLRANANLSLPSNECTIGGMSRREFTKFCAGVAATMGLPQAAGLRMAEAAATQARPPVIWLHGQECTGCTESLLRAEHPTLETLILDLISLEYHETLCAGAGHQAEAHKQKIMQENKGKYILVTEGGTPTKDNGIFCKVAGKTQVDQVREAADGAAAIIAIGSCASWGGIQSADPNPTGARPTQDIVPGKVVINIPGCPPNPYNFLSTVLYMLTFNKPPDLDEKNRPKFAYGRLIHENCE
ncbi:MAG: hydrogenase small subunit, partial [Rhodoplanes sp.]